MRFVQQLLIGLGALAAIACSTLADDLHTADTLYRDARYEAAEAWTQALLRERANMSPVERLRFEYLRGMCAYRLGRHDDALHYLALALELAEDAPDALSRNDRSLMTRVVEEQVAGRRSAYEASDPSAPGDPPPL